MWQRESHHEFRGRLQRYVTTVFGVLFLVGLVGGEPTSGIGLSGLGHAASTVLVTTVDGPITPVIADHVDDGIERAEEGGYDAYLVRLDTPGGLDTSMRAIVQDILASEVPVIVYISPSGARGASAGAVIALAAHVAAMAPGTSIGAATPVGGGGEDLEDKVVNDAVAYVESLAELRGRNVEFAAEMVRDGRSAGASEAAQLGAIDVVAGSVEDLLAAVDGLAVTVGPSGREVTLHTAGATVEDHDLGVLRSIQQLLADPNIAFLLLSIGTLGLVYELASPGVGVGGVLGLTFVVLGLFGLAVLSVDLVGVVFLLLAAVLFVAELFAPGVGLAAAGGALSLVLSGLFLIDDAPGIELSLAVILPTAVVVAGFVVLAGRVAMRARHAPVASTGEGALMGRDAVVRRWGEGFQSQLLGTWWNVRSAREGDQLADGAHVRVVGMDGLTLMVEHAHMAEDADPDEAPGTLGKEHTEGDS